MDERKLRLYALLLINDRMKLEDIPEPYKTELTPIKEPANQNEATV